MANQSVQVPANPSHDWRSFFWVWGRQVFNAWAILVAFLFLIVGTLAGYEISQPARYSDTALEIRDRIDDLETLLDTLQGTAPPKIHAEQQKLADAVDALRVAEAKLRVVSRARMKPRSLSTSCQCCVVNSGVT